MISVLLYFKILTYYVSVDVLAEYFKVKALGLIFYYFLSIRYSEFSYILKAQNNYTLTKMKDIFGLYSFYIILLSLLIILFYYIFDFSLYIFFISYLIFLLNDILDSYVAIHRLYNKYLIIFLLKGVLIIKPILFYLIFLFEVNHISFKDIFLFELYFHLFLAVLVFYLVIRNRSINSIFSLKEIYLENMLNIKNTWLGSVSKIPYEALPTYLLSFVVSSVNFVEYNVARKVYSMVIYANQPFIQVLNTYSIEYKNNFKKYCKLYWSTIIILNIFIAFIIFNHGDYVIIFLSSDIYATQHTLTLVYIMFSFYLFYNIIYPIRQYVVLNKYLNINSKATVISILILLGSIFIFIPVYKTYAISIIQPLGLILPLVITITLLKARKNENKKSYY